LTPRGANQALQDVARALGRARGMLRQRMIQSRERLQKRARLAARIAWIWIALTILAAALRAWSLWR
jgi:hypothetical protein